MPRSFPGVYAGLKGSFRFESKNKMVDAKDYLIKNDNQVVRRIIVCKKMNKS